MLMSLQLPGFSTGTDGDSIRQRGLLEGVREETVAPTVGGPRGVENERGSSTLGQVSTGQEQTKRIVLGLGEWPQQRCCAGRLKVQCTWGTSDSGKELMLGSKGHAPANTETQWTVP